MRTLVTGGAGFIGSNLSKKLVELGHSVDIVDDMSNGHREFVPEGANLIVEDFASGAALSKVSSKAYDVVFHLAAVPRVSYSVEYPFETNDANVTKTLKLMNACRGNVKRIVFASSSSVYGGADQLPTPPSHSKDPKSPYALQKSIIEDYLKLYNRLYGLDSICLRFFNVFGPNQLGDSPYSTAVSAWLTAIYSGRSMRSDGDGSQSRDMCYVDNVVDACVRGATVSGQLNAEAVNVACGDRTTNKEILTYLLSHFPDAKHHDAPWRPGDVMHTQADVNRSKELIGYEPLVRFWDGLERTIKWYDENWDMIKNLGLSK
ncbi:MAG: NAD-dependent epimerase/dehydratase family protein [Chlamydiae bacterium]|nr:NAD-dependent epimerase/dehydratase family protein [Chlamydiota bacterium]